MNLDKKSKTLFVASHADIGAAIEVFKIDSKGTKATWKMTITHNLMNTPNSILPLSEDEILFTNDHKFPIESQRILSTIETYLALPGGSLIYLNTKTGSGHHLANIPFANGIGRLNKTHIAVSSTTLPAVLIYELSTNRKTVTLQQKLRPRFYADNLRVDANGKLLIAGHPWIVSFSKVSKTQQKYDLDGTGEVGLLSEKDRPRAASWVVEWDGNPEGVLKDLYIGDAFGTSTTAARDVKRGVGFIGGLYDKGILVWKD
jgi:arylesterase/paraoxonase